MIMSSDDEYHSKCKEECTNDMYDAHITYSYRVKTLHKIYFIQKLAKYFFDNVLQVNILFGRHFREYWRSMIGCTCMMYHIW